MSRPKVKRATASSGDARLAIDDRYAMEWTAEQLANPWLEIDLGGIATPGGLEVYWGDRAPKICGFQFSLDRERWSHLCSTNHGEGGQDVFAFPPVEARFVRFVCEGSSEAHGLEIIEINLYAPDHAASTREKDRIAAPSVMDPSALRPARASRSISVMYDRRLGP